MNHHKGSIIFTVIALLAGFLYGMYTTNNIMLSLGVVFTMMVLSVLEVSLSFDNAVANARVLKDMTPEWQHRFLTWGMVIAVFGMRIVFPVVIVALVAKLGMFEALLLAINNPQEYSRILNESHIVIAGFGGAFLFLVALEYFFDSEKDIHWVAVIEKRLSKLGERQSVSMGITIVLLITFYEIIPEGKNIDFLVAGLFGVVVHEAIKLVGSLLESEQDLTTSAAKNGLASFLYLEVLDASFSFDGVIGAFVITTNIFIIAGGLGIGAMFVRSMTIQLVKTNALSEFRYLEHGAFYSIAILAIIMFTSTLFHIPELITGVLSITFIGLALLSSIKYRRLNNE